MENHNNFIIQNDLLKVVKGIKNLKEKTIKCNLKDKFYERRSEFASLTRSGYNMCQIAKKFGISRQAVSLALQKAVKEGHIVYKTRGSLEDNPNYKIVSNKRIQEIKCCECGNVFATSKKRKTCSKECLIKHRKHGGEWSRVEFVELSCVGCGKKFNRTKYLHKITSKRNFKGNYYCSRKCYCTSKLNCSKILQD